MDSNSASPFDLAAILITLSAALSWLNHKVFKLPSSVGLALMGAIASLIILAIDWAIPTSNLGASARSFLLSIDFRQTLMEGMLSFLLFAGALHVNWRELRKNAWPVVLLSTLGVIISTIIVGLGLNLIARVAGFEVPVIWCLLFGALISPTDPVAVMAVMKRANTPPGLQATISGESLFNDGVGVVVFTIILAAVASNGALSIAHASELFVVEALGGVVLGVAIGWIAFRAMRAIDDYPIELLITLAVVMGGYSLAQSIHVSGPVAMAVAGLIIGNHGVAYAMSQTTQDYLIKFWALVDEVLNTTLFLLIGLEGVALIGESRLLVIGLVAIPLVLLGRTLSILPTLFLCPKTLPFNATVPVLVWGGLRGGISIALALSLPNGAPKDMLVCATYVVVLFSVLMQGATISKVILRSNKLTATSGI